MMNESDLETYLRDPLLVNKPREHQGDVPLDTQNRLVEDHEEEEVEIEVDDEQEKYVPTLAKCYEIVVFWFNFFKAPILLLFVNVVIILVSYYCILIFIYLEMSTTNATEPSSAPSLTLSHLNKMQVIVGNMSICLSLLVLIDGLLILRCARRLSAEHQTHLEESGIGDGIDENQGDPTPHTFLSMETSKVIDRYLHQGELPPTQTFLINLLLGISALCLVLSVMFMPVAICFHGNQTTKCLNWDVSTLKYELSKVMANDTDLSNWALSKDEDYTHAYQKESQSFVRLMDGSLYFRGVHNSHTIDRSNYDRYTSRDTLLGMHGNGTVFSTKYSLPDHFVPSGKKDLEGRSEGFCCTTGSQKPHNRVLPFFHQTRIYMWADEMPDFLCYSPKDGFKDFPTNYSDAFSKDFLYPRSASNNVGWTSRISMYQNSSKTLWVKKEASVHYEDDMSPRKVYFLLIEKYEIDVVNPSRTIVVAKAITQFGSFDAALSCVRSTSCGTIVAIIGLLASLLSGYWLYNTYSVSSYTVPIAAVLHIVVASTVGDGAGFWLNFAIVSVLALLLAAVSNSNVIWDFTDRESIIWAIYTILLVMYLSSQRLPDIWANFDSIIHGGGDHTYHLFCTLILLVVVATVLNHAILITAGVASVVFSIVMLFLSIISEDYDGSDQNTFIFMISIGLLVIGYCMRKIRIYIVVYAKRCFRWVKYNQY